MTALFLLESNQLDDGKVLLLSFMLALKKAAKPIMLITQMPVSYLTWCCKVQHKHKARKNKTSATSICIQTKTSEDTCKVMHTTLELTLNGAILLPFTSP